MYNDPSGEFFAFLGLPILFWKAVIIGAAVGVASYTVGLAVTGNLHQWNLGGALKAAFWGGVGGAVSFGVGSLFSVAGEGGKMVATALAKSIEKAVGGVGLAIVQAGTHAISQGVLGLMQGGDFVSSAVSGFAGSLGASAFGAIAGDFANSTVGTVAFGALSGGIGAELSGGNFWQGAVIGGIVAGLNHAMHKIDPDNGYDRNGKKINDHGGDTTDYMYNDNGEIISSTSVKVLKTGTIGQDVDAYGLRIYNVKSGGLINAEWDVFSLFIGVGELKIGYQMIKNGLTLLSKSNLGYKVLGGASKYTLKSSIAAKRVYGNKKINLFNGRIKSLPYIHPMGIGTTRNWSSFYGRNSVLFGVGRVGLGGSLIYK